MGRAATHPALHEQGEPPNGATPDHHIKREFPMRDVATALAAVLVAFMFIGCASAPERREKAFTATAPEFADRANSCRQYGRTTMVRGGECAVDLEGEIVHISGNVDVTPGRTEAYRDRLLALPAGIPCLRLQIKDASPFTVKPYGKMICGGLDGVDPATLDDILDILQDDTNTNAEAFGSVQEQLGPVDATLLMDGHFHIGSKAACHTYTWQSTGQTGGAYLADGNPLVCR